VYFSTVVVVWANACPAFETSNRIIVHVIVSNLT